jgi:hypothetical protein
VRTKSRGLIAVTSMIVSMSAMWTMADVPQVAATCVGGSNQLVSRENAREQGAAGTCNGNNYYTGSVRTTTGTGLACASYGNVVAGGAGGCTSAATYVALPTFIDDDFSAVGSLYYIRPNGIHSPKTSFIVTGF